MKLHRKDMLVLKHHSAYVLKVAGEQIKVKASHHKTEDIYDKKYKAMIKVNTFKSLFHITHYTSS